MTFVQARCLAFIAGYIEANGCSPNYAEIGEYLGLTSKSAVHRLVARLIDHGKIRNIRHSARSIELVGPIGTAPQFPRGQLSADWLVRRIATAHGIDDGDGIVIACTPAELLATLEGLLASRGREATPSP